MHLRNWTSQESYVRNCGGVLWIFEHLVIPVVHVERCALPVYLWNFSAEERLLSQSLDDIRRLVASRFSNVLWFHDQFPNHDSSFWWKHIEIALGRVLLCIRFSIRCRDKWLRTSLSVFQFLIDWFLACFRWINWKKARGNIDKFVGDTTSLAHCLSPNRIQAYDTWYQIWTTWSWPAASSGELWSLGRPRSWNALYCM